LKRKNQKNRRKLKRELTTIVHSPFFLTFSGRLYIKVDDILVKPPKAPSCIVQVHCYNHAFSECARRFND